MLSAPESAWRTLTVGRLRLAVDSCVKGPIDCRGTRRCASNGDCVARAVAMGDYSFTETRWIERVTLPSQVLHLIESSSRDL